MKMRIMVVLMILTLLCAVPTWAETEDTSGVASAEDMTDVIDIVDENMVPVTADQLNEGTYPVNVDVSSSMFKVVGCDLTVAEGTMTAKLYMKSDAYSYMFPGTAEDAAQAAQEDLIALESEGDVFFFTLPVEALDAGYTCAAFSARKQMWYPRTLVFRSDSLPAEAWSAENVVTAATLGLADGSYSCDVVLEGKGKTTLESPATLTVENGVCTADIVFSTAKIDYVLVGGEKYLPTNEEGNAAFTVPVAAFDRKLEIVVDSTAIKPATEVSYTMTFDPESIR